MVYKFKDIESDIYKDTSVLFLCSQYNIFNRIVSDKVKEITRGEIKVVDSSLLEEFGVSDGQDVSSNILDFDEYMEAVRVPPVSGRWYCNVDYKLLSKKQRDRLDIYYKNASINGVLVVVLTDYRDYKRYLKDKLISSKSDVNIMQLNYPNKQVLKGIVKGLYKERGLLVDDKGIELFIMRLSSSYDDYIEVIDKVEVGIKGGGNNKDRLINVTYDMMLEQLKGIENYVIDDFIKQLTVPMEGEKIRVTRRIYKMEGALLREYGAKGLIKKLKYKIDDIIEMRLVINRGIVPIRVKYSVLEARDRLDDGNRLNKLTDLSFRRVADVASRTSLQDWLYIKLLLNIVGNRSSEIECERVIHTVVNRSVYSKERLLNDLGVGDIIKEGLYEVNRYGYSL